MELTISYMLHSPFLFSPRGISDGDAIVISSQLSVISEMIQRRDHKWFERRREGYNNEIIGFPCNL